MSIAILIPAYKPGAKLVGLVSRLQASGCDAIVVVDDGSGSEYSGIFEELRSRQGVHVLQHAVNLGKGAALKTGVNHILCSLPDRLGVVTADADGQHHPEDILAVARRLEQRPDTLVLGVRQFGKDVPLRSRFGNKVTKAAVRLIMGESLADTQTGLRGIPRSLMPFLLKIASTGYEFELDMLITAKHHGCAIVQQPIRTIYEDQNRSSHFNPLLDSMRIYFVLLRFSAVSLMTAVLDNFVFLWIFGWTGHVLSSQVAGRVGAILFNYSAARKAVFLSDERHRVVLPKYLSLVAVNGAISYGLIELLSSNFTVPVVWAKPLAEGFLFLASFAIQRDFVFTRKSKNGGATDWDAYYRSTPPTAKLTRRYTSAVLLNALEMAGAKGRVVVEIGGANSCFLDRILAEVRPSVYHVIDTNEYGLQLLRERLSGAGNVVLHRDTVLGLSVDTQADVVFSVGLIEHFDPENTRKAIQSHFDLVRPGGHVILSFPTPTLLYRIARGLTELAGQWKFPDERPLSRSEVAGGIVENGEIIFEKTLWPLVFTQHLIVCRKFAAGTRAGSASA